MQFRSTKILTLIFLMFIHYSNVHALEKKPFKTVLGAGLLAGAARYAWLEYKKPGEEKLTQFYKNRKKKNIIKYTATGILSSWICYNIITDPQGSLDVVINPANIHKFVATMQSAVSLYTLYKLYKTFMKGGPARVFKANDIKERFSSVAGVHEAKKELQEIISFLKNPEMFEALGTKIRRGVLLTGAPGNGKTLLAKATAGEANCSFLTISGSEFIEGLLGGGAANVRSLFEQARNLAPCIIFIDEIDSFGGKRTNDSGMGNGGGTAEHHQTLNELLTQMDGFEKSNAPIIIMSATNRPEMLDAALLRAGRFDSKVEVPLPDEATREEILKVHAKNYKMDQSINFNQLAKLATGFSGADLASLINDASHIAVENKQQTITMENFHTAQDKSKASRKLRIDSQDLARVFTPRDIKERFSSVAGAHGAKEELQEVISFLKNPETFEALGTKIRKGVLLTGSPGNGKTLLVKATAGEANCPFLTINGSEFVEKWTGTGASRVRKLFEKARSLAPCIIFIDEIDSLGGKRVNDSGSGGQTEHNQTLNELLTQMDGFEKPDAPIIVIGATNRPEMLDSALLRPGRFDSKIEVSMPDIASREQILKVHAKNYKVDPSVDFNQLAKLTMGFSGADLANLINEASHIAATNKQQTITMENFSIAYDKVALGKETKTKVSEQERKITAYHEAGHALVQLLLPNPRTNLDKITIVPRGHAGGYTRFVNKEETMFQTREDLLNEVRIGLGGRIAEEIIFKNVTGGASSDLENVTRIVRAMVCRLGMTANLGTVVYNHHDHGSYSQDTGKKIDDEIRSIIQGCYKEVRELLEKNKDKLEALAQALLVQETLTGEQAAKVIGK